ARLLRPANARSPAVCSGETSSAGSRWMAWHSSLRRGRQCESMSREVDLDPRAAELLGLVGAVYDERRHVNVAVNLRPGVCGLRLCVCRFRASGVRGCPLLAFRLRGFRHLCGSRLRSFRLCVFCGFLRVCLYVCLYVFSVTHQNSPSTERGGLPILGAAHSDHTKRPPWSRTYQWSRCSRLPCGAKPRCPDPSGRRPYERL